MSSTQALAPSPQSVFPERVVVPVSGMSWGMPTGFVFTPSRGGALTEAEVAEIAGRLVRAGTEAERDHLLAISLTHAARRAGGGLTVPLGTTLGRTLKGLREHEAGNPRDFAAARRLVRLAAEAAREAVMHRAATARDTAVKALATAASVHAPRLLPTLVTHRAATAGHWIRTGDGQIVVRLAPAPSRELESESFEYDPEMDYFLGGLIHSVGRAVGSAAKFVGRTVEICGACRRRPVKLRCRHARKNTVYRAGLERTVRLYLRGLDPVARQRRVGGSARQGSL